MILMPCADAYWSCASLYNQCQEDAVPWKLECDTEKAGGRNIHHIDGHRRVRMELWRAVSMKERERGRSARLREIEREREGRSLEKKEKEGDGWRTSREHDMTWEFHSAWTWNLPVNFCWEICPEALWEKSIFVHVYVCACVQE